MAISELGHSIPILIESLGMLPIIIGVTVPTLVRLVHNRYGPRVAQSTRDALKNNHSDYADRIVTMEEKDVIEALKNGSRNPPGLNGEAHHVIFRRLGLELTPIKK